MPQFDISQPIFTANLHCNESEVVHSPSNENSMVGAFRTPAKTPESIPLEGGSGQLIVMVSAFDAGEPGFVATSDAEPALATSLAGIATLTCVASAMVVVR